MAKMNWEGLKGEKVSILLNNPKPNKIEYESYVGRVVAIVDDDFLFIDMQGNDRIKALIVRKELILSIWIYK